MPPRFQQPVKVWVYRFLVLRDGERCHYCGITLPELRAKAHNRKYMPEVFDIDHYDGNKKNDDPANLRLACRNCNVKRENEARAGSESFLCVYEINEAGSATRINKEVIGYHNDLTATMAANGRFEIPFRNWILDYIRTNGFIFKKGAVTAGAEMVGCSTATAARYLEKLTSFKGPLTETADMLGGIAVVFKPELDPAREKN